MSTFTNIFSSETTGPIEAKFHVACPWDRGTKGCSNGPGHMTKMAAMPINGKNLKNLLLRNQKAYDLETWYIALGGWVLKYYQVYSNNDAGLTLPCFTTR